MEESIRAAFDLKKKDPKGYSPLTLAYVGDSVYELVIRTRIVENAARSLKSMNAEDASLARATTQAGMLAAIEPLLTDEEAEICRRGRNASPESRAKHASMAEYRMATGFEALIGYLYLSGEEERLLELIKAGWSNI